MTLLELSYKVRQEYDTRHLKRDTRYRALNNVINFVRERHGGTLSIFNIPKDDFKLIYEKYKISIGKKFSSAEKSAINEIYNQLNKNTITPSHSSNEDNEEVSISTNVDDLMSLHDFKSVCDLSESMIPSSPGLYAIRIKNVHDLPAPFCEELINRKHDLLYIGKASVSLRERLWEEELHHARPATFFRSIGAILGFRPEKGSLYGKDTRKYQFSKENTNTIIAWMKEHLLVNFITISSKLGVNEEKLILENKPIINILKNPYKMEILNDLRDECVRIAKEK